MFAIQLVKALWLRNNSSRIESTLLQVVCGALQERLDTLQTQACHSEVTDPESWQNSQMHTSERHQGEVSILSLAVGSSNRLTISHIVGLFADMVRPTGTGTVQYMKLLRPSVHLLRALGDENIREQNAIRRLIVQMASISDTSSREVIDFLLRQFPYVAVYASAERYLEVLFTILDQHQELLTTMEHRAYGRCQKLVAALVSCIVSPSALVAIKAVQYVESEHRVFVMIGTGAVRRVQRALEETGSKHWCPEVRSLAWKTISNLRE